MQADTVSTNVTVVTHDRTFARGVAIRDGKISALAERSDELPSARLPLLGDRRPGADVRLHQEGASS